MGFFMSDTTQTSRRRTRRVNVRSAKSNLDLFSGRKDEDADPQIEELRKYQSRQITDPFAGSYGTANAGFVTIAPSYSPAALLRLPNENSILRQCIDAYCVNIESFGHRFEYIGPEDERESDAAQSELARVTSLTEEPNDEYSLIELRQRLRRDIETLGYGFIEVARDGAGDVAMIYHAMAHTMRLTHKDREATETTRMVSRNGVMVPQVTHKRFRRFVQMVNGKNVYFKEFGDPRPIDPATGKVNTSLPIEEQATELYHISLYASGEVYGLPRWINQLPNVLGTRESELTNLQFFKDNAIPAMAVLVSGGMLTDTAVENIEDHMTNSRGRESMNRLLVLEASGDEDAASEKGQIPAPRIDLKPLSDARQKDGTFQEYETKSQAKIRSSFRLPPLFLGMTEDMTYATASASLSVAEGQVFGPERNKIDEIINNHLLMFEGLAPIYWRFRSNPPRISNPQDVIEAIDKLDAVGAMTPNVAIGLANEMFDLNIPTIEEAWGDYPISFSTKLLEGDYLAGISDLYAKANDPEKLEEEAAKLRKLQNVRKRTRPKAVRHAVS